MLADLNLSEPSDSGSFTIISTAIQLEDVPRRTISVDIFGTIDLEFTGLVFDLAAGPFPVTNNVANWVPLQPFQNSIIGGSASITNPTGALQQFMPLTGIFFDFNTLPLQLGAIGPAEPFVLGTVDDDGGLFAATAELNLQRLEPLFVDFGFPIQFAFTFAPDVHLAAVPEPATLPMASLGFIVVAFCIRRRRPGLAVRSFKLTLSLSCLCLAAVPAQGGVEAYAISGENTLNGEIAGGYFLFDSDSRPSLIRDLGLFAALYTGGMPCAVDDNLSDNSEPSFRNVVQTEVFQFSNEPNADRGFVWMGNNPTASFEFLSTYGDLPLADVLSGATPRTDIRAFGGSVGPTYSDRPFSVPNPKVQQFTAQDIFRTGKSALKPVLSNNDTKITINYKPYLEVDKDENGESIDIQIAPSDVVRLMPGVHHLNWLQTITLPENWSAVTRVHGEVVGQPQRTYFDPVPFVGGSYTIRDAAGVEHDVPYPDTVPDGAKFYRRVDEALRYQTFHQFNDQPGAILGKDEPVPNEVPTRIFETELVGVLEDLVTPVRTGLKVRWKSNSLLRDLSGKIVPISGGIVILDSVLDPVEYPTEWVSGGIFDVEVFQVPEPSALALAAFGVLGLLIAARFKR
jgi:hypothetical protein